MIDSGIPVVTGAIESVASVTSVHVAEFLATEALLLDEWRLQEWLELFEEDATYLVPATDRPEGDAARDQFLISDSHAQIKARVRRLESRNAHAERPRSRTRRLVTNALVVGRHTDAVSVTASFVVYRFKNNRSAAYIGQYRHVLGVSPLGLRFRRRMAVLDIEALNEEGRISVIL